MSLPHRPVTCSADGVGGGAVARAPLVHSVHTRYYPLRAVVRVVSACGPCKARGMVRTRGLLRELL